MRRRWRAAIKRAVAAVTSGVIVVETVLACWTHRTDGTIHTPETDQASGWRPPALVQRNVDGGWGFDASGVLPVFDPDRRNGATARVNATEGDTDDDDDTPVIATANGVYAYNSDWNDIEKSTRPTRAAAALMHRARQRTDTSMWWSMRWPPDAVSLLGRACDFDTGKTYELLRQLRELSVTHLRQLWRLTTERRQLGDDSGARRLTQVEWGETKRRLGPTGRNAKRKLMPGWATVAKVPLYKPKRLLAGWKRVRTAAVLRGGQRTVAGFATKHARSASG